MSADPCAALIPDGQYRATYIGYEHGRPYGEQRWFAQFKITELGEHVGNVVTRFYNVPRGPYLARTSNLSMDFVDLIGRRPPTRGLTPDRFLKGCDVLVQTATVKHRIEGRRRIELPWDCWYSKIDRLIRITAGSPPCGLGSRRGV